MPTKLKTLFILVFLALTLGLSYATYVLYKKNIASTAVIEMLQNDLTKSNTKIYFGSEQLNDLKDEKASLKNIRTESNMTIADQAKRLQDLQAVIQSQRDVMSNLKNSIADALINYETDELSIYTIDGSVYVSLAEKLLFKSGSDVVDPKGIEALKSLATVLNKTNDIQVMIEGHTDNVPIKTAGFKDNWELSTARAVSIVRILTTEYGFDSGRITASGRGQFFPINTNETAEGRAGNRRTEIILSPDLNELMNLLDYYE
jgi:chemotaxis protein MotB